jgi:hypothetical protein
VHARIYMPSLQLRLLLLRQHGHASMRSLLRPSTLSLGRVSERAIGPMHSELRLRRGPEAVPNYLPRRRRKQRRTRNDRR